MTKVNQLLEKALSTQSEEEAISCLRLARKRHTGETVTAAPTAASQSQELYWREQAQKYFRISQNYEQKVNKYMNLAVEYNNKFIVCYNDKLKLEGSVRELKTIVQVWKFMCAALVGLAIVGFVI